MKFAAQTHVKIPISSLFITDNVRLNYDEEEILQLAQSIRNDGLLNPITVRPPVEVDCVKKYEIIAGHRRFLAIKKLCENGDDFSMVECCIRSGEKLTLQIVENIQRTDLSSREKEEAIQKMLDTGLSQTEISERLAKPLSFISDTLAGAKVRKLADDFGFDTENITTKTLSQLRSVPEENIQRVFQQLINMGGTYRAATLLKDSYKQTLPDGWKVGDQVDYKSVKNRLFFKDLFVGKYFILNQSTESLYNFIVCKVEQIQDDHAYFSDGTNYRVNDGASVCKLFVDGADENCWIYEITSSVVKIPSSLLQYRDGDSYLPNDESTISPKEISEKEFYSGSEIDFEIDKKEHRFITGSVIDKVGDRLYFKDLWIGRNFVKKIDGRNVILQVTSFNGNGTRFDCYCNLAEHSQCYKTTFEDFLVDGDDEKWFIFSVPNEAEKISELQYSEVFSEVFTTHASNDSKSSSKVENLRSDGVKLYQLNQFLRKFPSNTPLKILFDSKLYSVFSVEYDEKNKQVIFSHDPFDAVEEK